MQYASWSLTHLYSLVGANLLENFDVFPFSFLLLIYIYIITHTCCFSACGSYYRAIIFRLEISLKFFFSCFDFQMKKKTNFKFYGQMFHMSFCYLFYLSILCAGGSNKQFLMFFYSFIIMLFIWQTVVMLTLLLM